MMRENPHYLARSIVFVCLIVIIGMMTQISNDKPESSHKVLPGATSGTTGYVPLPPDRTPLERAQWHFDNEEYELAIDCCSNILVNDPENVNVLILRGRADWEIKDSLNKSAAIADFESAVKYDENNPDALYWLGYAYEGVDNTEEAITILTKVIELDPEYRDAYIKRANAHSSARHAIHKKKNFSREIIADYTKVIEIDPQFSSAFHNRGFQYELLGEHEKALADYAKAIELNPNSFITFLNRSEMKSVRSKEECEADYAEYLRLSNERRERTGGGKGFSWMSLPRTYNVHP